MKKLIISEAQEKRLISLLNEETYQMPVSKSANKPYTVNPDKVLIVKKFLDDNFQKGNIENVGPNGMPQKVRIVAMMSSNGDILKNMYVDQVNDLLIEKFKNMFSDHSERELFMKQVLKDWLNDKIGTFGNLSVNNLK